MYFEFDLSVYKLSCMSCLLSTSNLVSITKESFPHYVTLNLPFLSSPPPFITLRSIDLHIN